MSKTADKTRFGGIMSKPYKDFEPKWITQTPDKKSYRAIMKWGDPAIYKAPKEGLYKLIKQQFDLTDDDFKTMVDTGEEICDVHVDSALTQEQIDAISAIVGKENATTDDFERVRLAYGKTMIDIMRLRKGIVENVPDFYYLQFSFISSYDIFHEYIYILIYIFFFVNTF